MQFQILGPLDVRRQGRQVALGPHKQRALLAILLVHANELVPSDRLIEDLWPQPPETAANTLQVYVGKLRKALEPGRARGAPGDVLITRAPGYMLRVEAGQLDAERFETLLADGSRAREAGQNEAAADGLRDAIGLWRGDALADFVYEPFAQAEIARLEELRTVALEERLEADLALGRHAAVLGALESLVREHPLRERPRGQLMLALYRAGRQADALEVYRDARRTLTEELGIVPGPELQRLEGAILRQEAELEPVSQAPLRMESAPEAVPSADLRAPTQETRKLVTVLVAAADVETGLDPEALLQRDERLRGVLSRATERYGGTVQTARGDQVMVMFGVPTVHEDDAVRAVHAAVEARERLASDGRAVGNGKSGVRIGIATGEALVGESDSGEPSVVGDAVGIAGRLQETASPGEILLADETRRLVGGVARAEPLESASGGGWRLLELVAERPPFARPSWTPIVGRDAELARLREAFEQAVQERSLRFLTIVGPPGIGKSRLATEFVARTADEATVLAGRCVPYGEGITFWPLREIVRELGGPESLRELLAREESGESIGDRLSEVLGLAEATSSREEIFWAARRLFEAIARERPLVLAFEDVHWAEATFLDLIEYLGEGGRGVPILLVCVGRPELVERRPEWDDGKPNTSTLMLGPLSDAESEALIERLAPTLAGAVRDRVLDAAGGNPLFVEQMVAMLAQAEVPDEGLPIPPTIQALLAARLDRLGPGERAMLARAAVIGRAFPERAAVELLPADAQPFATKHLDALVGKELIEAARADRTGEEGFRFGHELIQEATYRSIPKRLRGELHESFATWLEKAVPAEEPEYPEVLGYHLEQAFRYRAELGEVTAEDRVLASRAADLLADAGGRAFRQGDMPASVNLLDRAVSLLPPEDPAALMLLSDLGYALFEIGEFERASAVLAEAIKRGRACGERGVEWGATVKLGHVRMWAEPEGADLDLLGHEANRAIEVLDGLGDDAALARAWLLLNDVRWMTGEVVEAQKAAKRAADHARRARNRQEEARNLACYAICLLHGPTPVAEAKRILERLLDAAGGNPYIEASLSGYLGCQEAMSGHIEPARAHAAQSRELSRDLGLAFQTGCQSVVSGYVELLAGDPVAAEGHFRDARDACSEIGDRWWLSTIAVDLPRPVYEQGRYEDAFALLGAIDEVPAPTDREWLIKRTGVPARLLARRGQLAEAEKLAREGVAVAADSEFIVLHADVLLDLAEVLHLAGRVEDARAAAAEAVSLYERKGNVVSAARARAFTEELACAGPPRATRSSA